MGKWAGDFSAGQNVDIRWESYTSLGGSVTRSSQGTVRVAANNSTTSWSLGVTDSKDLWGTGLHNIRISTGSSNTLYTNGNTYNVFLSGDSIDGQLVNLGWDFSLLHRGDSIATYGELASAPAADGPTRPQMLQWNYQVSRTSLSQTSVQEVLKSSNNSSIATATLSDDGTTFQRRNWV